MNKNYSVVLIIGGGVLAILMILVSGLLLVWGFRGVNLGPMGTGMMGGFAAMLLIPLFFLVVFGFVVWAIVATTQKSIGETGTTEYQAKTPLDILKRRYAQGEIDKAEYETKKGDLA